jgi:hypothetical protein
MATHLTRSDCEGFQVLYINAMDGTDDMLWNGSNKDRDIRSECEEDEDSDTEW